MWYYDSVCWNGNLKFPAISLRSRGCGNSRLCFLSGLPWNEDNSLWLGVSRKLQLITSDHQLKLAQIKPMFSLRSAISSNLKPYQRLSCMCCLTFSTTGQRIKLTWFFQMSTSAYPQVILIERRFYRSLRDPARTRRSTWARRHGP